MASITNKAGSFLLPDFSLQDLDNKPLQNGAQNPAWRSELSTFSIHQILSTFNRFILNDYISQLSV